MVKQTCLQPLWSPIFIEYSWNTVKVTETYNQKNLLLMFIFVIVVVLLFLFAMFNWYNRKSCSDMFVKWNVKICSIIVLIKTKQRIFPPIGITIKELINSQNSVILILFALYLKKLHRTRCLSPKQVENRNYQTTEKFKL